jgi:hypothetical protein
MRFSVTISAIFRRPLKVCVDDAEILVVALVELGWPCLRDGLGEAFRKWRAVNDVKDLSGSDFQFQKMPIWRRRFRTVH